MIGETLRKTREESGLDLHEIARTLKIRHEHLKAIENNDFEKLPADVFTIGYIREYAKFLNISADPLIEAYKEYRHQRDKTVEINAALLSEKKISISRRTLLYLVMITVIVTAVAFLIYSKPAKTQAKENMRIIAQPAPSIGNDEKKLPSPALAPQPVTIPQPAPTPQSAPAPKPVTAPGQYILKATAVENTWLRIDMDNGRREEMLMKPGESKEWSSQKGFSLWLGNAGGLRLTLNNKDLGSPGLSGHTLRLKLPAEDASAKQ